MHAAIWDRLGDEPEEPPAAEPLTLVSYVADTPVKANLEHLAVGKTLPDMPLFLDPDLYINTPLEATYETTWNGTPTLRRDVLEAPRTRATKQGRKRGPLKNS